MIPDPKLAALLKAVVLKGVELARNGDYIHAIECYEAALDLVPTLSDVLTNKGLCHANLGQFQEAAQCYHKALTINPSDAVAHYNWGVLLSEGGNHDEALPHYKAAVELDRSMAAAWGNKAVSEEHLCRTEDAINSYQRFVELSDSRNEKALEFAKARLDALMRGTKGATMSQLQSDDRLTREAMEHLMNGCYSKAIELTRQLLERNPNNTEARSILGRAETLFSKHGDSK
jgi:tetratricopeptide (TPR) repeat protein